MKPGKKPHLIVLYTLVCALVLLAGCGTPATALSEPAYNKLMETIKTANADGVITQFEAQAIGEAQANYYTALKHDAENAPKGLDLWETIGVVTAAFVPGGAAIAAAINAYRTAREKKVWGTPENPKGAPVAPPAQA